MTADGRRPRGTDEVVEALVAAAARLLGDDPPERISGRRLAAEAGVNYGLIHHYFGGKEAVLREGVQSPGRVVWRRTRGRLLGAYRSVLDAPAT